VCGVCLRVCTGVENVIMGVTFRPERCVLDDGKVDFSKKTYDFRSELCARHAYVYMRHNHNLTSTKIKIHNRAREGAGP